MRLPLLAAMAALMVLTACGGFRDSRLNPMNWFGRSEQVRDSFALTAPEDNRNLVEDVTAMVIEQVPTGAIVRATGVSPSQGYYQAELVALPIDANGVLVFEFRIMPPPGQKPAGTPRTRQVTVAAHVSHIKLEGVSEIVVQGANNARSSRR